MITNQGTSKSSELTMLWFISLVCGILISWLTNLWFLWRRLYLRSIVMSLCGLQYSQNLLIMLPISSSLSNLKMLYTSKLWPPPPHAVKKISATSALFSPSQTWSNKGWIFVRSDANIWPHCPGELTFKWWQIISCTLLTPCHDFQDVHWLITSIIKHYLAVYMPHAYEVPACDTRTMQTCFTWQAARATLSRNIFSMRTYMCNRLLLKGLVRFPPFGSWLGLTCIFHARKPVF